MQDLNGCERAYIGAILNGDARATDSGLTAGMFLDLKCRQAFASCQKIERQGMAVDLVTLCDFDASLDACALVEMANEAAPVRVLIAQHAQNIRTAAMRRSAGKAMTDAITAAMDSEIPLDDTLSRLRAKLDQIAAQTGAGGFTTGTDALCDLWDHLSSEEREAAISTGLPKLDGLLNGGLKGGKLIVIGARPAVGKSALMSFIAVQALKAGKRVLIDSLEMDERENTMRMLALTSGVTAGAMELKNLRAADWEQMASGLSALPGEQFRFVRNGNTLAAVRSEALRMRADGGLDLVLVDYLQLMTASGKTSSRAEAVGEISRGLKILAMELGVPVLVGAQVNRASTQGEERPPRLSELRESGSIEQDADLVMMLHAQRTSANHRQLIVAKNRQGKTGGIDLVFYGDRMLFAEGKPITIL